jgi:hypothetical protein
MGSSLQTTVPGAGWVRLGALTRPVTADSITVSPAEVQASTLGVYDSALGRYEHATQTEPGKGYWIFVAKPCMIRW